MNKLSCRDIIKLPSGDLFDYYMGIIKGKFPKKVAEAFSRGRKVLFNRAMQVMIPYGNLCFVPVFPPSGKIREKELMQMIEHNEEKGVIALNESKLRNVERVPNGLYFMLNVECGRETLGKSPQQSETKIQKAKRNRLVVTEGINLCIFVDILSEFNIDCTGSRYGAIEVPHIHTCRANKIPTLGKSDIGDENQEWGSPSCTGRHAI